MITDHPATITTDAAPYWSVTLALDLLAGPLGRLFHVFKIHPHYMGVNTFSYESEW